MKLRTKLLVAIVPVVAGALAALGWAVYGQLAGHAGDELERHMALVLDRNARQVRDTVQTLRANAALFASSDLIERYVLVEDEGERYDLMQPALLGLFAEYRAAYPGYREIRLVLPDGYEDTRLAAPGIPNRTEEEAGSDWFARLPRGADPVSRVEFAPSEDDGVPTLLAAHAIRLPERDRSPANAPRTLRGWLVVATSLEAVGRAVEGARIGHGGGLVLTGPDGRAVFPAADAGDDGRAAPAVDGTDPAWIVRSTGLPAGLGLHAAVPAAELDATRLELAGAIAALVLVAVALTSALLFLSVRRIVLDPIAALGRAARGIGEGAAPGPATEATARLGARGDEIGELARTLEEMRARLERSIAELRGSHDRIEELAFRDALTGLPNRRSFLTLVERALAAAGPDRAGASAPATAVLFLDLDDFKRVNDTVGHEAGDELLRTVAGRLENAVRARGVADSPVARLGGDEFTVLLPGLEGEDRARVPERIATRIIEALTAPVALAGREFVVGTSIGIALAPTDATDAGSLIKCADIAMYEAKRGGRNRYRRYGRDMGDGLDRRLELEQELRAALAGHELSLDYQPQWALGARGLVGAEALLRWRHPVRGPISPAEFVPIAEATGLIGEIGVWVLDEACRRWRAWDDAGVAPARVAVNVSARQLELTDLAALVPAALERHRMPPGALEVELTESCMMAAPAGVIATLAALRTLGVRVAMDDFGTGYSSLAALTTLPLDTLKIDRSFVTGIRRDSPNEKVVSAILTLARELGLEIVAEGVETEAELEFLREGACDVVQGYLLGRPLSVEAMTALLVDVHAAPLRRAG